TPSQEGLARGASGASPSRMTLSDIHVHALVKNMEACMVVQETKLKTQEEILVLKRDNSELWQEIHRLKGPRFPFEIFSSIICSMGEKKALATCSFVSRGWMSVTRGILFKRISPFRMFWLSKIELMPILNNEHCTVFPYWIQRSMPQSIKNNIKKPSKPCHLGAKIHWTGVSESPQGLFSPPPSNIKELSFRISGPNDLVLPTVLKWFVDLHSGIIDSIDPHDLPLKKSVEFGRFLTRFGLTLFKIKFKISGDEGAVQSLCSGYLPQLKSIQLDFWQQTFSYSYFDKSFLSTIEGLPKILALLPPSMAIEEKSATPQHKLGTINWSRLDQLLTGSQFPSFRILKIRMSYEYCPQEVIP
ncbi:hypothetical protein DFH09DRAFT_1228124, partial [Mycena vulgaris]